VDHEKKSSFSSSCTEKDNHVQWLIIFNGPLPEIIMAKMRWQRYINEKRSCMVGARSDRLSLDGMTGARSASALGAAKTL
jgi:hypothetical protein